MNNIIAAAVNPRAMSMAAWTQYSPDEFSGVLFGAQTRFFKDLLMNFPFCMMIYFTPNLQQYRMVYSAQIRVHAN